MPNVDSTPTQKTTAGSGPPNHDWNWPKDIRLRHRPVQQRGRDRFAKILRASRAVLVENGMANFVIEDVATAASIPVGSVYQFFPNKLSIIAELAELDTQDLITAIHPSSPAVATATLGEDTNAMIAASVAHWQADPSRSAAWLAMNSNETTRPLADQQALRVGRAIAASLAPLTADIADDRAERIGVVIFETTHAILNYACRGNRIDRAAIDELKWVIRGYIRIVAEGD